MVTEIGKARLLKLAAYLEEVVAKQPETFDMDHWGLKEGDCRTAACACGHACDIPEFKEAGLGLEFDEEGLAAIVWKDSDGYEAAAGFFELGDEVEATKLFSPAFYSCNVKPGEVAKRIREYVAKSVVVR